MIENKNPTLAAKFFGPAYVNCGFIPDIPTPFSIKKKIGLYFKPKKNFYNEIYCYK